MDSHTTTPQAVDLLVRVRRVEAEGRAMNVGDFSRAQWDAWGERMGAAYVEITALPMTRENAAVRAQALVELQAADGGWEELIPGTSTAHILCRQIIASMADNHLFGSETTHG